MYGLDAALQIIVSGLWTLLIGVKMWQKVWPQFHLPWIENAFQDVKDRDIPLIPPQKKCVQSGTKIFVYMSCLRSISYVTLHAR